MVITPEPELEQALQDQATQRGVTAEELALAVLRQRFLPPLQPRDEWERRLLDAAKPCGVSHT